MITVLIVWLAATLMLLLLGGARETQPKLGHRAKPWRPGECLTCDLQQWARDAGFTPRVARGSAKHTCDRVDLLGSSRPSRAGTRAGGRVTSRSERGAP